MRFYQIIILTGFAFLMACTETIDIKPADLEKRLVVDATLTNELRQQDVKLTITKLVNDTVIPPVTNAEVTVTDGTNVFPFIESDTVPGYYLSQDEFAGESGKTYKLSIDKVDVDGDGSFEHYEAQSTMGGSLVIDSVTVEYFKNWNAWALKCWAYDPPEKNFYNFKGWRNGVLFTDTLYEYGFTDDLMFNGNYTNGIPCIMMNDKKTDEHIVVGDTITLEIDNIDENYFQYLNSAMTEFWGYVPMFSGPPANVYSNISNNALGIFRVYTINKSSVIIAQANRE